MTEQQQIKKLQKLIEEFTGRATVSTNLTYLTRKLAELEKDDSPKRHHADGSVVCSISMPAPAREAALRMADGAKLKGLSELVRIALGEWAQRNGYATSAKHFILEEG